MIITKIENFMDWDRPGYALITGASSGIGEAFATKLAEQGFNILLVARREDKLRSLSNILSEKYSIEVKIIVADLSNQDNINHVAKSIVDLGNVDIVINNAGFGTTGYFDLIDVKPQIDMILVHNVAPVILCRTALPLMIKRGRGVIINVSSISSIMNTPQNVVYSASKGFLNIFSDTLSKELEGTGVKIQALCPGFTRTEFHYVEAFKSFDTTRIPENMWMTPEEVVDLSLEAVNNDNVVFIPGEHNQEFINKWNHPTMGEKIRRRMTKGQSLQRE